jgi:hypothetical protein
MASSLRWSRTPGAANKRPLWQGWGHPRQIPLIPDFPLSERDVRDSGIFSKHGSRVNIRVNTTGLCRTIDAFYHPR